MIRVDVGIASRAIVGETASADRSVVRAMGDRLLVAVVDGLGHGEHAVQAAVTAVQVLEEANNLVPPQLFDMVHARLRGTRGVVMSLAVIDLAAGSMQWIGVGNVAGVLLRPGEPSSAPRRELLVQSNGVVGHYLPPLRTHTLAVEVGDIVAFATDGVDGAFETGAASVGSPQQLAQRALSQHGRRDDDALVLYARLLGDRPQ